MSRGQLPPQAYTRETLSSAYQWLQTQPSKIRDLATDTDTLVTLFLKAKRNGSSSLETLAPVSTEAFRNRLKDLAGELDHFSEAKEPSRKEETHVERRTQPNMTSTPQFDKKSMALIQDVKERLNLSTDVEALRALIILGYEKIRSILP